MEDCTRFTQAERYQIEAPPLFNPSYTRFGYSSQRHQLDLR